MARNEVVRATLLMTLVFPMGLTAQTETQESDVILVWTGTALVQGNADGTQAADGYVVPAARELCVRDIAWEAQGEPGADVQFWLSNTNTDGVSFYQLWVVNPTLNGLGWASGLASFHVGPRVTANGGISLGSTDLAGLNVTIYATERSQPEPGAATPCA